MQGRSSLGAGVSQAQAPGPRPSKAAGVGKLSPTSKVHVGQPGVSAGVALAPAGEQRPEGGSPRATGDHTAPWTGMGRAHKLPVLTIDSTGPLRGQGLSRTLRFQRGCPRGVLGSRAAREREPQEAQQQGGGTGLRGPQRAVRSGGAAERVTQASGPSPSSTRCPESAGPCGLRQACRRFDSTRGPRQEDRGTGPIPWPGSGRSLVSRAHSGLLLPCLGPLAWASRARSLPGRWRVRGVHRSLVLAAGWSSRAECAHGGPALPWEVQLTYYQSPGRGQGVQGSASLPARLGFPPPLPASGHSGA